MNPLKRKNPASADTEQRKFKIPRVPQPSHSAGRPVIKMILEDGTSYGTVMNVLLDTGCTNRQQVRQANRHPILHTPRKSRLQGIQRANGRRSRKGIHSPPPVPTPTPLLQIGIRSSPVRTKRRPISPLLVAGCPRNTRKMAFPQSPVRKPGMP